MKRKKKAKMTSGLQMILLQNRPKPYEVKSGDMLDAKGFRGKDKHNMFTERQVEPNHYVDYRNLSSE